MRTSLLLIAVVGLSACGDDEPRAPLSPGGSGPQVVGTTRADGGETVDDDDAGRTRDAGKGDGPMPLECTRVDAVMIGSDEVPTVTSTESPTDFHVTRQVATWRDDCVAPTLVVELSNGVCPNGQGHELEIRLPANAIGDGQIGLGFNQVEPELEATQSIRVRYTRPERYAPVGVYGTCDGASGQISFYDAPDVSRAMNLRARYELTLTACDGKHNAAQVVSGFFDVRVRRTLTDYCPR